MTFERTTDYALIKEIVTHPEIWPDVSDDFSPSTENWEPIRNEDIWYVLVKDGTELIGMWILTPHTSVCWEVHTCILPIAHGRRAKEAAKQFAAWVWKTLPCLRVTTEVPRYNRHASIFARWAGLKEYGVNPAAYMKNGELQDVILLGISKPGVQTCQ